MEMIRLPAASYPHILCSCLTRWGKRIGKLSLLGYVVDLHLQEQSSRNDLVLQITGQALTKIFILRLVKCSSMRLAAVESVWLWGRPSVTLLSST